VREHKNGRHRYYQIEPQPLQELSRWLTPYERFWRQKLASLHEMLGWTRTPFSLVRHTWHSFHWACLAAGGHGEDHGCARPSGRRAYPP
jgi:hypothetical protein